jgi:glycosyltransferase involved in cell wall biosynthesis
VSAPDRPVIGFAIDALSSGGAQRQLVELAVALKRRGRFSPVVFVYYDHDFFAPRLRDAGVPIVRVPRSGARDVRFPLRFAAELRLRDVALVHAFLFTPAFWAWLATRTFGRARPALVPAQRDSFVARTRSEKWLQRLVYRTSECVTANAEPVAEKLVAEIGVARERVHYLPNGIDLARWDAAAKEACPLPLEPGRFHIGLIGGLRPQKNHALLFRALALVPAAVRREWHVWCVGDESSGSEAARRIRAELASLDLGEIVRIEPAVANVSALFARLGVVVLTSTHEGFPNVLLEAQASALPVISTRVGDVANLVEDGASGYLIGFDEAELAEKLQRLAADAGSRARLGARGRAIVEARYAMELVAELHEAFYARVLAKRPLA